MAIKKEVWLTVADYENYEVSSLGRVRNINTGRILKPCTSNGNGYYKVCLCKQGERKNFNLHRLVLTTFNPVEGMEKLQVNHIDEDKSNNCLSNLEWCDCKYNINYGTGKERARKARQKKIEQYNLKGEYITTYESVKAAAAATGAQVSCVSMAANGLRKSAGGFAWKFAS